MSFLLNIFKAKPKPFVVTQLGRFNLTYSKGDKNIWTNSSNGFLITVKGSNEGPDPVQLSFFQNINELIKKLDNKIYAAFINEFRDSDLDQKLIRWEERFKIVSVSIIVMDEEGIQWNITFEQLKEPFAHFVLHMKGLETNGFSIDT